MEKKSLILIGGGGHCKACIDVVEAEGKFDIQGILDKQEKIGTKVLAYPVIGTDEDLSDLVKEGHAFLITVGQIKNAGLRKKLYEKLKSFDAYMPNIISPFARISKYATLGEGTIVMHNGTINANAKISNNCILNTGCNIEHDVEIAENCHISTNVTVNGDCVIGKEVFIGSGSVITNGVQIHSSVVIGAGSLVLKSIDENGTFVGNPIRKIKNG